MANRILQLKSFEWVIFLNMFLLLALCICAANIVGHQVHAAIQ